MADRREQIGRLAFRVEGDYWVAYFAPPSTMDGALLLGSLHMTLAGIPELKSAFMDLMRSSLTIITKSAIGQELIWPEAPHRAPEHERSGRA